MNEAVLDFQKIHADFRPKILRYLSRMVGEYEAEDLTQEVFLKISQALDTFRCESQLSTWIYRVATNAALDKMRSPSFKRIVEVGSSDDEVSKEIVIQDKNLLEEEEASLPEQHLCHKERIECYLDCLKDLPVNYRMIVALTDLKELPASEIADIMGLNVDVVKIRLHRGREKLLKVLRSHCKAEDWL